MKALSAKIWKEAARHYRRLANERRLHAEARFWSRVDKHGPHGCWLWRGSTRKDGYGTARLYGNETKTAHRVAWELSNGPILDAALFVCHRCDNPSCVNPAHLFLGTHNENMGDMTAKGRSPRGSRSGHAKLTEDDVRTIRHLAGNGESRKKLAATYGVNEEYLSEVIRRKKWKHVA